MSQAVSTSGSLLSVIVNPGSGSPAECGVTYIESLDLANPAVLRALDSGSYVLYGKFKAYSGDDTIIAFESKLNANIVKSTDCSSIMIFNPVNSKVECLTIYDDRYERTDVALQDVVAHIGQLKNDLDEQETLYRKILQIKNTANLLNQDKLEFGKYIDINGNIIDNAKASVSEFIPVNASIPLRITTNLNQVLIQYNAEKIKIKYTSTFSSAAAITLNQETKYIRMSVWNSTLPFMVYQSDNIMTYVDYGKYSENVRKTIWIYTNETEEEIYLKLYNALNTKNCDVYWECGTYEFSTIFELLKTKYNRNTAYELPIGGNCRYYFNGATIIGTGISTDSNVIGNSSVFGTWRTSQSYELHDGTIIANHLIYCVHEEASSQSIPYNIKYSNMRMYHNTITEDYDLTYGLRKCIGAGTGLHPCIEVANCFFQTDHGKDIGWHGHSKDDKTTFYLNIHNCYFSHGISTDNMSTNETCELLFSGNSSTIIPTSNHNGTKGWKVVAWGNEKRSS